VSSSLHLITEAGPIHLELAPGTDPTEVLSTCQEAMRAGRVIDFADALAPGAVHRTTVVVNFSRVSTAWIDAHTA
jgi:hypothetical protein